MRIKNRVNIACNEGILPIAVASIVKPVLMTTTTRHHHPDSHGYHQHHNHHSQPPSNTPAHQSNPAGPLSQQRAFTNLILQYPKKIKGRVSLNCARPQKGRVHLLPLFLQESEGVRSVRVIQLGTIRIRIHGAAQKKKKKRGFATAETETPTCDS